MKTAIRQHATIALSDGADLTQPRGRVRRVTVAPRGLPPVDALVARPPHPQGLTWHFVGFNTTLGPWEAAKASRWAESTNTWVVMCELPGFSRYADPLPASIRHDLLEQDPASWARATLTCLKAAAEQVLPAEPPRVEVLGFSTGCTLAAAVLPQIQAIQPVSRLTLIEPVALSDRTLGRLALHNVIDLLRLPGTIPANIRTPWVRQTFRRQTREAAVRYGLPDFLALITLLSSADTLARLSNSDLPTTHLVRGDRSQLSPRQGFDHLDQTLSRLGTPGITCAVTGFGHQLWHSQPLVGTIARRLAQPGDSSPANSRPTKLA